MKGYMIYQILGLALGAICCLTIIYIPFFLVQVWIYRRTKELVETYEISSNNDAQNELGQHSSETNLNGEVHEMQKLREKS